VSHTTPKIKYKKKTAKNKKYIMTFLYFMTMTGFLSFQKICTSKDVGQFLRFSELKTIKLDYHNLTS